MTVKIQYAHLLEPTIFAMGDDIYILHLVKLY